MVRSGISWGNTNETNRKVFLSLNLHRGGHRRPAGRRSTTHSTRYGIVRRNSLLDWMEVDSHDHDRS